MTSPAAPAPIASGSPLFGTLQWDKFQSRYRTELDAKAEAVARCLDWCRKGPVVLLYGAKDRDHNQAVVLRD